MCTIGLISKSNRPTMTAVPNRFIDEFMADANGTYVKVYLYLLRHLDDRSELSVSGIAELLDCTEKFLRKALDYWTKQGLLEYTVSDDGTVESINLVDLSGGSLPASEDTRRTMSDSSLPVSGNTRKTASGSGTTLGVRTSASEKKSAPRDVTRVDIDSMSDDENVPFLLSTLEQYFARPLSREDTETALYIYGTLGFSCELLLFLYEKCIEKKKTSPKYIEKVAIGWHEDGIASVEDAENYLVTRGEAFFAVCDEFGLEGNLGASQVRYLRTWVNEWHMPASLIREACSRAMLRKGANFQYANSILKDWHTAGATTDADIARIDQAHKQAEDEKHKPKATTRTAPAKANRFENFTQRDYSPEAMAEIEKRMRAKK